MAVANDAYDGCGLGKIFAILEFIFADFQMKNAEKLDVGGLVHHFFYRDRQCVVWIGKKIEKEVKKYLGRNFFCRDRREWEKGLLEAGSVGNGKITEK